MVKAGNRAPDITLATLEEQPVPLAQTWQGKNAALLIFLRHLG